MNEEEIKRLAKVIKSVASFAAGIAIGIDDLHPVTRQYVKNFLENIQPNLHRKDYEKISILPPLEN